MKLQWTPTSLAVAVLAWLPAVDGCVASDDAHAAGPDVSVTHAALTGDHLSGISDEDFAEALASFSTSEDVDDGLGPIFNDVSCSNCHDQGAIGGAGASIERRFGRFVRGSFDPLAERGGSLRQLRTLGNFTNASGHACSVPLEVEPQEATVKNVGRLTTPLFGLGLVDAMPDSFFVNLAASEPKKTRGIVNFVPVLLPDPGDASQALGSLRVGRFGWKAGVPTLVQFAADAYVNEMGITTQHCIAGTSVTAFATESAPNGVPVAPECEDNLPGVDDAVGPCGAGQSTIQDDVAEFAAFMTFLAPAARERDDSDLTAPDAQAPRGRLLFDSTGCADCHTRQAFVTPSHPANGVPGNFPFHPFSDFLVHDMGPLGDSIGNAGDAVATTRLMRTAPLWGIRFRTRLLHDGRAGDVSSAILAHAGDGGKAAKDFDKLNSTDKGALLAFVSSL